MANICMNVYHILSLEQTKRVLFVILCSQLSVNLFTAPEINVRFFLPSEKQPIEKPQTPPPLTSTVLPAQVREPPDVPQADGVAHARQQEVKLPLPAAPVGGLLLLGVPACRGRRGLQLLKGHGLLQLRRGVGLHRARPGLDHGSGSASQRWGHPD